MKLVNHYIITTKAINQQKKLMLEKSWIFISYLSKKSLEIILVKSYGLPILGCFHLPLSTQQLQKEKHVA